MPEDFPGIIRRASAKMRKDAAAASCQLDRTPDRWFVDEGHPWDGAYPVSVYVPEMGQTGDVTDPLDKQTAEHIASWDPTVALATADLLDSVFCGLFCSPDGTREQHCSACDDSTYDHDCPGRVPCNHTAGFRAALSLAKTYLRENEDE